jgi:CheY-like chemotaxis protein
MSEDIDSYRGDETILIADDDAPILDIIARTIRGAGYTVLTANDGQEAIDLYRDNVSDIKLTILDIIMEKIDGETAYNEIKKINSDAVIIFITGSFKEFTIPGNPKIIRKPFMPIDIIKQVRSSIDQNKIV